jgi:hypothetical protein
MNQDLKKYLKVGGILCAIGAVSAILITCTNLLTAPKIAANEAEKKAAGFRSVYENTASVGDDVTVNGHYVSLSNVCYSDAGKTTEIGTVYTASGSYKHVSGMKILIGVSGDKKAPVLGKVYLLKNGATGGYDATVKNNYVDKYNANPSLTTMNNVTCGATEAATIIRTMMIEAKDLYASGGVVEDIESELKSIYPTLGSYGDANKAATEIVDDSYASAYYPIYSDAERKTYLGSVYRLKGLINDGTGETITILAGVSGHYQKPTYDKLYVVSNGGGKGVVTYTEAYNAAPSETTLAALPTDESLAACTLVQTMVNQARKLYEGGIGNLTADGPALRIFGSQTKGFGDDVAVTGYTYVQKYNLAYSDIGKTTVIGYIFQCHGTTPPFTPYEGSDAHQSTITLLVGYSGEAASPTATKPVLTYDDSWDGSGVTETGSTYSNTLIKSMVVEAAKAYAALKGGN